MACCWLKYVAAISTGTLQQDKLYTDML